MLSPTERKHLRRLVSTDNSRLTEVFDALSDANRCRLFRLIAQRPGLNVTEAAKTLGLSLPLTSQHFKILEQNRLLHRTKSGREVHYWLNRQDATVSAINKVIKE